jgi:hypothetical protein
MTTPLQTAHVLFAAACLLVVGAGAPLAAEAPREPVATLFVHVNVVPMDSERVLRDQSVLVEDGRIAAVGPALAAPAGARIVDGHGTQYLAPGLADMHVHADTRLDMALFIANGVTTVLNMGDARSGFVTQTRAALDRGDIPGPHVLLAFVVDGTPEYGHFVVTTPLEARSAVHLAKANGYDYIKVYNNLSPECFDAIVDQGRAEGLPVVGHGVTRVGLERQLAAGQVMVAHAEEYLYTVFFDPAADVGNRAPDAAAIPRVVEFTKKSGAYVTADLNTYATIARQWGKPAEVEDFLRRPEARYLDPADRIGWARAPYGKRKGDIDARLAFLRRFTRALSDAGVPLLAGTDTPGIPGLVPGWSLHEDLAALVDAGLTRYQALAAATRTAGAFVAATKPGGTPFGVVRPGARADLVLVAGDPLADLATLRAPLGVMKDGRWYDAAALQAMLDTVAAAYDKALRR